MSPRRREARTSGGTLLLGFLLLAVAVAASAMLVVGHLGGGLPGCGPGSACGDLARSAWGKVPGIGWPTSHLGLAFFAGLLLAWQVSRGRMGGALRPIVLVGGLVSLVLLGVMAVWQKLCPYCLAAHLANLAFVGLVLRGRGAAAPRGLLSFGVGAVAVTAVLGALEVQTRASREVAAEAERQESTQEMARRSTELPAEETDARWGEAGFRGRFLHGPEEASIRIVMLTDYQCPDCKRVESELRAVLEERDDIHLSVKHFPMCREAGNGELCNRHLSRTLHRNACWAARAAEAAGIVGGDRAFFEMHFWLFDRGGEFTREELTAQVQREGLDADAFFRTMESRETLEQVRADIEDGYVLGLHFTPMVFINGVEFKGWHARDAIRRTIAELAATGPPARPAGSDLPVFARTKYEEDWLASPRQRMPADAVPRGFGAGSEAPEDEVVDVVVWGDYQEENTARVDRHIRGFLEGRSDVRYRFRHYPVDPRCNSTLPPNVPASSIHPRACWAAQVAEAAAVAGGDEAYRRAHVWLIENWERLDDVALEDVARAAEVRPKQLEEAMASAQVSDAIQEDAEAATRLGVRSIPLVYIEQKRVPRTARDEENVMSWLLARAAEGGF